MASEVPDEGPNVGVTQFTKGDEIASAAGQHVLDNFAAVTGCAAPTQTCAQTFVATFAERAYRRPLTSAESTSLSRVFTEALDFGATIQQAVQYSIYAVIESPYFLYRTEFGSEPAAGGFRLDPYETASLLSFFVVDGPPDQTRLAAASNSCAGGPSWDQILQVNSFFQGPPPTSNLGVYEFLTNVHTWYNQKLADVLIEFKSATDGYGGNLLDHTVVPVVTNVAHGAHARSPLPALIFGGRALGIQGGQYQSFESAPRTHNDLWLSVAQAYLGANPMSALASETFAQNSSGYTGPIPGLWSTP